jgi:ABC-type multidrug transport system permease subunit
MLSLAGQIHFEQLIVSTLAGLIIIVLLFNKYTSLRQKKFDAIIQMLGSTKEHSILHQFLNTSTAAFISLLIFLVLADFTKLLSTNFNFLDTFGKLSLNNLPMAFLIILGINLIASIGLFLLKKESNFFKILRS